MSPSRLSWVTRLIASADDWECVHLVASDDRFSLDEFRARGFHVATISGETVRSELELFDAVASAFVFPRHSGRNWNAVKDYLGDLEWLEAEGYILVIEDVGATPFLGPLAEFLQTWLSIAQEWSEREKPFHLVFLYDEWGAPSLT